MKSRKNTIKRGGAADFNETNPVDHISDLLFVEGGLAEDWALAKQMDTMPVHDNKISINDVGADTRLIDVLTLNETDLQGINTIIGGTKRMSRKSRKGKKTKKGRGGTGFATYQESDGVTVPIFVDEVFRKNLNAGESSLINNLDLPLIRAKVAVNEAAFGIPYINLSQELKKLQGGSKRKSRKSRKAKKTKKGRVAYEGGKKKCPKHCRRKTRRSRKRLKHRKN